MQLGTIESIWRYPVKGMRGEEIPHTYTAFTGLMGDRVYGVVAADGSPGHPWHTGRDQEEFILYSPRYKTGENLLLPHNLDATYSEWEPGIDPIYPDTEAFKVSVETPEGVTYDDIQDPAFIKHLEKLSDRSLRIHVTQRGQFDARPVSLISLSAVASISEGLGIPMDKRRFRANFYVQWDNQDDPCFELTLVGKTLKVGDKLELMIVERDPRCKAITLDPDTAEATPKLLRYLARAHDGDAGVFAVVLQRGRVNKGDPIVLK
ncbi:MAG: MOSC domain-containing protein [Gammaproteobacteria bacterium]|nr:MOSC domain-containing protein [Gammaproteobacteria bacterium]MCP4981555.1 MOSC domain-containing protein [Gammaproteobacteria bacterium]